MLSASMTCPRVVPMIPTMVQLCSFASWVLILPATHVDGLPYGPVPPEAESGFSFKTFKDFILAGVTPETHTHDPAEKYIHKGQEPVVAEVAIPANGPSLLVENVAVGNQNGADLAINKDGQPPEILVGENKETIQQEQLLKPIDEAVETLDVPHEHPKREFSDVIGEKLVAREQMDEQPAAKIMAIKEEI